MEKNSEFIRNKEFHVVFKGYNPEEVDKFLDILSTEFERLIKKNRELQESLDRVKFESSEDEETDIKKIIQDALVSAHKVADEIKNQARKDAENIAEKIRQEEEQALGDLKSKKAGLEETIRKLQAGYGDFKSEITKAIEEVNKFISSPGAEYDFDIQPGEDVTDEVFKTDNIEEDTSSQDSAAHIEDIIAEDDSGKTEKTDDNLLKTNNTDDNELFDSGSKLRDEQAVQKEDDGLKRERKKIDIANPDIIENFFRTNNE